MTLKIMQCELSISDNKPVQNQYSDCYSGVAAMDDTSVLLCRLEWCGLLVDYCDVFISCLDSHSDGTHSLQRIHW